MNTTNHGRAWSMVALAFLSQGMAYGMTFGLAGTFIVTVGGEFSASRAAMSLAPALVATLHGLLGPLIGYWLGRRPVRDVLTVGALSMTIGYVLMSSARDAWTFSLAFGVFGGVAVACLGITPVTSLVGRWFADKPGRALGIANMPILVTLLPPVAGYVVSVHGWRVTALGLAATAALLLPVLRLAREPSAANPLPEADTPATSVPFAAGGAPGAANKFRPDAAFWKIAIGIGILDAAAITIITHIIPMATETGVDYRSATLLVSVMGIAGMAGAPVFGVLADRLGGPACLVIATLLLMLGWGVFLVHPGFLAMAGAMALLGFCGGSFAALAGTALAARYPGSKLGAAVGLSAMVALPFNFTMPLLAGYIRDVSGVYGTAVACQLLLLAVAAILFGLVPTRRQSRQLSV